MSHRYKQLYATFLKLFGNIAAKEICKKTHFKFYIDAWYLAVTQAENTPSTATVDINITQQNPTLKSIWNERKAQ